jgi:uncharacterized protein YcbX
MTSQAGVGTIKTIWRYPVKSMGAEGLDQAIVTDGGILGDRAYALIDQTSGKIASAKMPKKWGKLLDLSAAYVTPPEAQKPLPGVRITWPSGESVESSGEATARLSDYVGRPVTLTTIRPEAVSLERLDPLEAEETILDIGEIMMEGRFSDYAALHLITTATLTKLAELSPEISFDAMRFRPNLLIEADGTGFVENEWVGKTVAIGDDIRLRISDPTPRCSIPTLAQAGGITKDPKVLRTIVTHNRLPVPLLDNEELPCAGAYAFVERGGAVRKGDTVRIP